MSQSNKIDFDFSDSDSDDDIQPQQQIQRQFVGLNNLTVYEKFEKNKLNYILKNQDKYLSNIQITDADYNPFKKPSEYLVSSTDGVFKTTYHKSSIDNMGRLFATGGLSLQNFCREIRHIIASDYYDDIDMVNAHPVILQHLCVKHDIDHPHLTEYIEERESIISDLIELNAELDRDSVKKCILSMINGGSKDYNKISDKTKWLKKFKREIDNIKTELEEDYTQFFKKVKGLNKKNPVDSALNIMFCDYENKMLMHLCEFLDSEGELGRFFVLCFDGIMICKDADMEARNALVLKASRYVSDKMAFDIKLKVKPMTEGFELPGVIEDFNEVVGIDASDPFTWLDFDERYRGKVFDSLDDCVCSTLYDLRRVFARVEGGKGYIIKKTDCNEKIHDLINGRDKHTDLYFKYKQTNAKGVSVEKELSFDNYSKYGAKKMRRYSKLDFAPGSTDEKVFNLFTGYKAQLLESYNPKKFKRIFMHIRDVVCDKNEEKLKYFMTWLAHLLERPGERTGVVVFLHSEEQGTGKNTLFQFLADNVIGNNYTREIIGLQPLLEKHNTVLMGRKFLVVNEARDSGNTFSANFDKLKSIITDSTVYIDPKGKDGFDIKNHLEIVISSNHYNSVKVEEADRRYFCMTVNDSKVGDSAYFKKLYRSFTDEAGDHFLTYVIKEFGGKRVGKPPMTPLKQSMVDISLPSPYRFLQSKPWITNCYVPIDSDSDDENKDDEEMKEHPIVSPKELYLLYEKWCQEQREPNAYKLKAFEMKVNKRLKKAKTMVKNRVKYNLALL